MYNRGTELRHMRTNDVYKLGVILDDNNCWKKLMEIIPRELDAQASSEDGALDWEQAVVNGFKYNNDHIRLIENAIKRPGESRLFAQILFDEWGTSGRKCERPTLGVLLQLLVKAELFRAADYVALHYLNEPPPERPLNGPAARIDITLSSDIFNDIEGVVNDTAFYPGTEALNDNANYQNSIADNNKDFYTKYMRMDKQVLIHDNGAPVPPPRALRTARLLLQQQQQITAYESVTAEVANNSISLSEHLQLPTNNMLPNFSQLITNNHDHATSSNNISTNQLHSSPQTESTNLSEAPIPLISALDGSTATVQTQTTHLRMEYISNGSEMLPVISALNLNGERDDIFLDHERLMTTSPSQNEHSQHLINNVMNHKMTDMLETNNGDSLEKQLNDEEDDANDRDDDDDAFDDDDDSSVPNLSIFEQRSSNNDSSLTNVTGTSGENSFELSMNDCSSASNENIPCLSALKP